MLYILLYVALRLALKFTKIYFRHRENAPPAYTQGKRAARVIFAKSEKMCYNTFALKRSGLFPAQQKHTRNPSKRFLEVT